jgi:Family of unknown function (DUF6176)
MASLQPQPRVFKIKDGKLEQWLAWCDQLNSPLRSEGVRTLKEEGALYEFFITFKINESYYTLGAVITPDGSDPKNANQSAAINQEHRKIKQECLEPASKGDFSYFISSTDS